MIVTKKIKFCLDFSLLKDALKYSIPIMPHNLSTHIALFFSQIIIGDVASLGALGVYSIAAQFGNIADTIQGYVDSAYGPWLYEKLNNKDSDYKKSIRQAVNLLISVIGLFFIGIALFAQDYIFLFIEKSYLDAWKYVPLIVLVFAIKTIYYFYVEVLFFFKKASKKLFIATLSSSLVNIFISAILIPIYGIYGSIAADAIGMFVRVVIVVAISKQFEDIGLKIKDFILNFFIVTFFILLGILPSFINNSNQFSVINFLYKIFVVILYLAMLFFKNKKQIFNFIKKRDKKEGANPV